MKIAKRLVAVFFFLAFFSLPVSASTVSFLVVETGLNEENNAGQYSSLWEGGLMSVFFDAGFIVSNGAILRLEKMPVKIFPDEIEKDFSEAVEGGAEYFILALLDYKTENGQIKPAGISLRLFSTETRSMLYEHGFSAVRGGADEKEYERAKQAGMAIIPYMTDR